GFNSIFKLEVSNTTKKKQTTTTSVSEGNGDDTYCPCRSPLLIYIFFNLVVARAISVVATIKTLLAVPFLHFHHFPHFLFFTHTHRRRSPFSSSLHITRA
ncbi:hypothetical protein CFOL_v3_31359, partial [Cephalotus follicularis]